MVAALCRRDTLVCFNARERGTCSTGAASSGRRGENTPSHARVALRELLDRIVIPRGTGFLRVEGNLGAMLAAARSRAAKAAVGIVGCGGSQPLIPTALYVVAA